LKIIADLFLHHLFVVKVTPTFKALGEIVGGIIGILFSRRATTQQEEHGQEQKRQEGGRFHLMTLEDPDDKATREGWTVSHET